MKITSKEIIKKIAFRAGIAAAVFLGLIIIPSIAGWSQSKLQKMASDTSYEADEPGGQRCSIMGIELHGYLSTYEVIVGEGEDHRKTEDFTSSDSITWAIKDAESTDEVKAILLEVDSYGGNGVAAQEIAQALKNVDKPTVALIRSAAASAAYWAATGADFITATAISDVGGIGIDASYLDNVDKNEDEGLTYNQFTSAKFKDAGSPDRKLTDEEEALLQRDLYIMHEYFVTQVATNRGLDHDTVAALADGSTMLGQMALDSGLIDKVGGVDEVIKYLQAQGLEVDKNDLCWY